MDMDDTYSKVIAIVPTYNERQSIGFLVRDFFNALPGASMLVVDDNSPDKTTEEVANLKKEFPNLDFMLRTTDRGFGRSYIDGFKRLIPDNRYDTIIMMDADLSHDPKYIPGMVESLSQPGCDIVVGSRYVKGGGASGWGLKRTLLSRLAALYLRLTLGIPMKDVASAFFVLKKSVLVSLDLDSIRSAGTAIRIELKHKIIGAGYKISEYPVVVSDRTQGQSKISNKLIWESLCLPWKIKH
ncbi:MAG TPA: polyprenol monophosphomannose synthase [Candidatus Paceibacterota bacterium]